MAWLGPAELPRGTRDILRPFFPLVVFFGIAFFFLYPIPLHLNTLVIGRPFDDAFESIWYLYWFKHAIFTLKDSPLFQPSVFYPIGWDLGFAVMPPFYPTLLSPLTAAVGHVAAYNLSLIASCVFAAYGTYLLARALGANVWGSFIAGVVFAFYPNRQVYLGGFLNLLLGSMWLPWVLYGLVQAARFPRSRTHWMALAGLALGFSIAGAWQFVIIGSTLYAIFGLTCLGPDIRRKPKSWIRPVAGAMILSFLVAGPLLVNASIARSRMGSGAVFSLDDLEATGVSLERLIVPSALNPLVWDLARRTFPLTNGEDGVVTLGVLPVLLALVAMIRLRPWTAQLRGFLALVLIGLLLMMGPTLRFWGNSISLRVPGTGAVEQVLPWLVNPNGSVKLPMPALALYRLIPPFRTLHHFGRWGLVVSLGVAALAGLGFTLTAERFRPKARHAVGLFCLFWVMLEFNTQPLPSTVSTGEMQRTVDRWLAAQPEQSVIIEYPLSYTMKAQSLYYTIAHQQKIVHGSSLLSKEYAEMLPTLNQWPDEAAIDLLEQIGVRYVLVHAFKGDDFEQRSLPQLRQIDRLRLIQRFATPIGPVRDIYLFELVSAD